MLEIKRTNSEDAAFVQLVRLLDAYLADIDGEEHAFYAQFNKVASLKNVVLGYLDGKPVACGAFKPFEAQSVEIKRMYVLPDLRGLGFATQILRALEGWAAELGYSRCVLETGLRQPEAIALYTKNGYAARPNFGQYIGVENSMCFEKNIADR
jgi:GNAT superfamily N-acetyltransferase